MKPFMFTGLGKLASLGQRSAVAEVFGIKLRGLFAWIFWRGIYLSKFPGFDRQIRIAMDWMLDMLLPRDITQVKLFQQDAVRQEHFHDGEMIFDEGDFGNKLYVIVKGEADILKGGKILATIGAGQVFGEIALVEDSARTAGVKANGDIDVITVSRPAFSKLVTHLPGVRSTVEQIMRDHDVDPDKLNQELVEE
jgi:NADH dehydrogenase